MAKDNHMELSEYVESRLPTAACHAAVELDNLRLGRHEGPLKYLEITHRTMVAMCADRTHHPSTELFQFAWPLVETLGLFPKREELPLNTHWNEVLKPYNQLCRRLQSCLRDYNAGRPIGPLRRGRLIKVLLSISELAGLLEHQHRGRHFLAAA